MAEEFDYHASQYGNIIRESLGSFGNDLDFLRRRKGVITRAMCSKFPKRILDFGCGVGGNFTQLLESFPGAALAGCDVSEKSLELAAQVAPSAVLYPLGKTFPPSNSFDLVFVSGVFHHVPPEKRSEVMGHLAELLAPGGTLIIIEHNPANPFTRKVVSRCAFDVGVTLLWPVEIEAMARQSGLTHIRRRYISFVPSILAPLAWIEFFFRMVPLGGQYVCAACKN